MSAAKRFAPAMNALHHVSQRTWQAMSLQTPSESSSPSPPPFPAAMKRLPCRFDFEPLRLSLEAWPLVVRVRWALWRAPFPAFHALWNEEVEADLRAASEGEPTETPASGEPDAPTRRQAWECAHAVSRTARRVPRASCLTQALVLQRLLARRGQPCTLFLGVDRTGEAAKQQGRRAKSFEAHAWIEWRGRVLIGGDISPWTPLPLFTPRAGTSATPSPPKSR